MDHQLRFLYLEDDPDDVEMVRQHLLRHNMAVQIESMSTLAGFHEALAHGDYALILADYTLPGLDAMDALKLARQMRPELPFIFLSGTMGEELAIESLKQGATDYVLKQHIARLAPAIQRALHEAEELAHRLQAEEALRRSEERLRLAQQVAGVGTFECNFETGETIWSPELEALYGLAPGGFSGAYEDWTARVHPEDRPEAERHVREALKQGCLETEWRVAWPDGQVRWLAARGQVIKDEAGRPLRMLGVNIDITERKRAERELHRSEERKYRQIIENATTYAIFTMDTRGCVSSWNPGAERILGYCEDEILGRPGEVIFTQEDRAQGAPQQEMNQAAEHGQARDERWHQRKDGSRFWAQGNMIAQYDDQGQRIGFLKILQDMTERKLAEDALQEANALLAEADRSKNEFLAMLAHELRNPLAPIRNAVQVLRTIGSREPAAMRQKEIIDRQVSHMARLLDDLLEVSRVTRGKIQLHKERLDLRTVVESSRPLLAERRHELTITSTDQSLWVEGDSVRLEQVKSPPAEPGAYFC